MTQREETVKQYIWPHLDFGARQVLCADARARHGQEVQHGKERAVFRLLDKDYDKEWLAEALPIAKRLWEEHGDSWPWYR